MLRLNEHYVSIQGEGPRQGFLTQFVRFSGCNLRCPGWPCDTQHAIEPSLYKNDPKLESSELADAIVKMAREQGAYNVCFTGGEPFMQQGIALRHTVNELREIVTSERPQMSFEFFTNGTFVIPEWAFSHGITMDWKLPGSGENMERFEEIRHANVARMWPNHAVKFVIKDRADFDEACQIIWYNTNFREVNVYFGVVWGSLTEAELVEWMKDSKLWSVRLNTQLHKYIWPNIERGI